MGRITALREDRGASMVEYSLLVSLIAIVSIGAAANLGEATEETFTTVAQQLGSDEGSNQGANNNGESDDQDDPGPGDDDPGGSNDDGGNNNNDGGNNNDDNGNNNDGGNKPGDDDDDGGKPGDDIDPWQVDAVDESPGGYDKWDPHRAGGDGSWTASASLKNDWIYDQTLIVEVTRIDEKGNKTTENVEIDVPAGEKAVLDAADNVVRVRGNGSNWSGTLTVEFKVVGVTTQNQDGETVNYETDGPTVTVEAPPAP